MSTFNELESAVADKRTTYKQMVEALYESNPELAKQLFDKIAISESDPKILRKKHRDAQFEKFGDDKEAIKTAMSEYDANIRANAPPGEVKPKPKPPVRVWSDEEKVYTKTKNAYVKSKEKEHGDDVLSVLKGLRKQWRKEYDAEHKDKKEQVNEESEEEEAGPFAEEDETEEDQTEVVEQVKPKLTKEQAARYKVLKKIKATQTAEEKAEYKALKAPA